MFFVEDMYKIFEENKGAEERFKAIEEWYGKNYTHKESERPWEEEYKERRWNFAVPLLKLAVKENFKTNIMAECLSGNGNGSNTVCTQLEPQIDHNKELITLLLAIAKIWEMDCFVYRKRRFINFSDSVRDLIESEPIWFKNYQGNVAEDIQKACKYDMKEIAKELVEGAYYHYLYISRVGGNKNNDGWRSEANINKVIIW